MRNNNTSTASTASTNFDILFLKCNVIDLTNNNVYNNNIIYNNKYNNLFHKNMFDVLYINNDDCDDNDTNYMNELYL